MDFVRSCYTVNMTFGRGGPTVPIAWSFAQPGAQLFPGPHVFYSRNWEPEGDKFDPLGEQPGSRPWRSGMRDGLLTGQRLCDPAVLFLTGLAPGQSLNRPVTATGVPLCCLDSDEPPEDCGGWGGAPDLGVEPIGGDGVGFGQVGWDKRKIWLGDGGSTGSGVAGWFP